MSKSYWAICSAGHIQKVSVSRMQRQIATSVISSKLTSGSNGDGDCSEQSVHTSTNVTIQVGFTTVTKNRRGETAEEFSLFLLLGTKRLP